MFEFFAAVAVFGMAFFAMYLGTIFGNRPLKGSCGGLNNLKKETLLAKRVPIPALTVRSGNDIFILLLDWI